MLIISWFFTLVLPALYQTPHVAEWFKSDPVVITVLLRCVPKTEVFGTRDAPISLSDNG
jgi:hypothetical protein